MTLLNRYTDVPLRGARQRPLLAGKWRRATLSICLALTACTGAAQDPKRLDILADTKAMSPAPEGNVAPLVRPLQLVEMEAPLVVDFELRPPGPSATGTLFLGLRVNAESAIQSAEVAEKVIAAGLEADVSLVRIDNTAPVDVPLVRVISSGNAPATLVPVGPEGHVRGVRRDDVDDISIEQVGRASAAGHSRYLSFASAQDLAPGRYRISVRIGEASADFSDVNSELLVAYRHRSK